MALRSIKNQYLGINAHLHSTMQSLGMSDFHAQHVVHIQNELAPLLRTMGYVAKVEESLQIRRIGGDIPRPKADVVVYESPIRFSNNPQAPQIIALPVMVIDELLLDEDELSEKPYRAVAIYQAMSTRRDRGDAVAWIELLSPSNKGTTNDAWTFRQKRQDLIDAGIVFVELDYLHESGTTYPNLPVYVPPFPLQASPYRIVVLDPRQDAHRGPVWHQPFYVDEPLPTMQIPLLDNDVVTFDFGVPYRKTFEHGFQGDDVDYSELPLNFSTYSSRDQHNILLRMIAVGEAAAQGIDLENAPFPLPNLSLQEAKAQLVIP